ncbi:hypothetical protein [Streptomyces sp. NPDC059080]|uniref:hypothetical protein n=1 Tax=Streptomyces sp. NPDC059080 TaxID=3346718 RepID=UPI0036D1812A
MQGVPGRTAFAKGGVPPSGQSVVRSPHVTGAARAAEAVPPHVAAPLPLLPRFAGPAGPR